MLYGNMYVLQGAGGEQNSIAMLNLGSKSKGNEDCCYKLPIVEAVMTTKNKRA